MSWISFGNGIIATAFLCALAAICFWGLCALGRKPVAFLVAFAILSVVATIKAQKTDGKLEGLKVGKFESSTKPSNSQTFKLSNLSQTFNSSEDIARGWRVESVTTNAAGSYTMPSNGTLVGNWHVHGASSSFGNNRIDFGDWRFPIGTNGAAFSSFWYFIDGRIRPTPKDAAHEICAVGVPMSAVPGQSRLWTAEEPDGSRVLTWENFFLGGDTNAPVNAQIRLYPNGDFTTRSNEVETVCRRVNPDDWDDDGIPNDSDLNPLVCDGDFFGPANILPDGANINAYCTVSLVATGPDTLVVFEGDGPSDYPDPRFVARHGETNEVLILIGKTYTVSSAWPIEFTGASDPETEIFAPLMRLRATRPLRGETSQTHTVRRPVSISASDGNPFTMSVVPSSLGGVFSWNASDCGCSISGSGNTFSWNCSMSCTCCGTYADGWYSYEGYRLPATSCACGCRSDGEPEWTDSPGPLLPSVSVSFSKAAVIFEDAYENEPGQWVGKRSTRTRLNIVANGGPNGGMLAVTSTNLAKLERISGPDLPFAPVTVPPETQVSYSVVYEGAEASDAADDVAVAASVVGNGSSGMASDSDSMTSVRLELAAVWEAPENPCTNRHVYGVGEKVNCIHEPAVSLVEWSCDKMAGYGNRFIRTGGMYSQSDGEFVLAYFSELSPIMTVMCGDVAYHTELAIVEPQAIFVPEARLAYQPLTSPGEAGGMEMDLWQYVLPRHVSFRGVDLSEAPCTNAIPPTGYFANPSNVSYYVHSIEAGAARWNHVKTNNYWTIDSVHMGKKLPPWSDGALTWKIPIGWRPAMNDPKSSWPIGVEPIEDFRFGRAVIGDSEDVYHQTFGMEDDGTASICKFGWVIIRGTNGVVKIECNP